MRKYDELSGKSGNLTVTPYGLLMDIIIYCDVKIYLLDSDKTCSLDLTYWDDLNAGLYKRLKELSEMGHKNVIVFKDWSEISDYEYKQALEKIYKDVENDK